MKTYNIGIIGYGGFGRFLHHWWSKLDGVDVVAVADHGHNTRETAICRVYDDWRDLVDDPGIDIIAIVTPPALHVEMACAAMNAGKHVLLEKPVALSPENARYLLETQRQTGRVITVDHMIRYNPIIGSLMAVRESGVLGKLRHAVVNNYAQDEALPPHHWFWDEALSGGILVEHGVHFFDIISALSGQRYTEVYGSSDRRNERQRDRMAALVKYDGGLIASYYHGFSGPGPFEQTTIHLAYDLARIEIEGWMPLKGKVRALANADVKAWLQTLPGWELTGAEPLDADESRPEGWGASETAAPDRKTVYGSGIPYEADQMISGTFAIPRTKGEVYGSCVQSVLQDIIHKIGNPAHRLTITLEDGIEAVRIATLASR